MNINYAFKKSRKFPYGLRIEINNMEAKTIIDWFNNRDEVYGIDYIYYYMKKRHPWGIFSYIYFLNRDLSIEFKMVWA